MTGGVVMRISFSLPTIGVYSNGHPALDGRPSNASNALSPRPHRKRMLSVASTSVLPQLAESLVSDNRRVEPSAKNRSFFAQERLRQVHRERLRREKLCRIEASGLERRVKKHNVLREVRAEGEAKAAARSAALAQRVLEVRSRVQVQLTHMKLTLSEEQAQLLAPMQDVADMIEERAFTEATDAARRVAAAAYSRVAATRREADAAHSRVAVVEARGSDKPRPLLGP